MRHFGPPPSPSIVYRERRGAYGLIIRDGHVLLAEQDGDLLLPGGGIDPGETPIRALHREVYEETGWRIGPPTYVGAFTRHDWLVEERYHARKVALIFRARAIRRLGPPLEPDHSPVWVEAAIAPSLLSVEGEAALLAEIVGRRPGT
jgi:8-oxo-dGTP diphosphatase